jgi:hypothetical protein
VITKNLNPFYKMSSVTRHISEPTSISKRFTVLPYYGFSSVEYYFTVSDESLYRIETDLSGSNQWVVARDMGTESAIKTIDPELIEFWETANSWTDISVIRQGRARKFQALAIPQGDFNASNNNGPAWNAAAYTLPDGGFSTPYYNNELTGINDLLIMGEASGTTGSYTQSLPFATFYAVIDPVVIQYTSGGNTYTRAIVNRVTRS